MARGKSNDLSRNKPKREPYKNILIVCEGEKTEIKYFKDLMLHEKLTSVNIKIISAKHSNPDYVVKEAIKEKGKREFNKTYCVIDRDSHENFDKAKKSNIDMIISYPCFEYWYLCHFRNCRSDMNSEECISVLNKEWQDRFLGDYSKNIEKLYSKLKEKLDFAIDNATHSLAEAQKDERMNPSTQVHILVNYLRNIRKIKN